MESFVSWAVGTGRAKILNITSPACKIVDVLTCHQKEGLKGYATDYALYAHTADFCKAAVPDLNSGGTGRSFSHEYNKDTLDHAVFTITKDAGADKLHEKACNDAVNTILDGCDGNDPDNPMNWKFGGRYVNGHYTYNIAIVRKNRPFPPPREPSAKCQGWNKFILTRYNIRGAGWASWDFGRKTLKPNSTNCFGSGMTDWSFKYFDEPDKHGYEWLAKFNSAIWTEGGAMRTIRSRKIPEGRRTMGVTDWLNLINDIPAVPVVPII